MWNNVEKDTLAKKFDLLLPSLGGERCQRWKQKKKDERVNQKQNDNT